MARNQTLPARFLVSAKGSHPLSEAYTMTIQLTERTITIDGLQLSWNDARAAFDTSLSYSRHRNALFPKEG